MSDPIDTTKVTEIKRAMWEGDLDKLNELAGCECCCGEHTFSNCPAREWDGCRSGLKPGEHAMDDAEAWRAFYGMTNKQFYGE
jgi:hypothetical protein